MEVKKSQKVICAMSGGVDSSVAAALLKRAGFDVVGVFMKFWSEPERDGVVGVSNRCCSLEAEIRAREVAKILKIPFYVFDFSKEFKKRIVDYFLEGYKNGITPNPCVLCNKEIKFGLLLEKALQLSTDFVATGHYAKIKIKNQKSRSKSYHLMKAKDKNKDQSYFLWMLNQEKLKRILFPIGGYTRAEVEKMAEKFKLRPVLGIKKSFEICFIQTTLNDFLKKYLKEKPGKIVDGEGKILGAHQGLWFYTLGQRKGIKALGGPYFVLDKDLKRNFLIVTKNEKDLYKKELVAQNINWLSGKKPKLPLKVKSKIRYRQDFTPSLLFPFGQGRVKILFEEPQRAITPGQSVVFYRGQELLGGGIITK